jgi:hypothetical protein
MDGSMCNRLTLWNRVLRENLIVTQLGKKFSTFYGTRKSLPCSQKSVTGPYSEPGESSPHLPTLFP